MISRRTERTHIRRILPLTAVLALAAVVALAGCNDKKKTTTGPDTTTPTTTTFTGVIVGSGAENGTISITVQTTSLARSWYGAVVTATGVLEPQGGTAVALAGTYDSDKDSLYLSGGGYALAGEYDPNTSGDAFKSISGGYSGPNGIGGFGAVLGSSSNTKVFLGTFVNTGATVSGKWDMVVQDTLAGCLAFPDGGTLDDVAAMIGSVHDNGASSDITLMGGVNTTTVSATGIWDHATGDVSGTWNSNDPSGPTTDDGTWTGSLVP